MSYWICYFWCGGSKLNLKTIVPALFLMGCATSTAPPPSVVAQPPEEQQLPLRALAAEMAEATVLLRMPFDDGAVLCTGTWVSRTKILTAAHCAKGKPTITDYNGHVYHGEWLKLAEDEDLALAVAPNNVPQHRVGSVAKENALPGDFVSICGHPLGLSWSFMFGVVSADRVDDGQHVFQVQIPAGAGDSGAALFDRYGKIQGVISYIVPSGHRQASGLTFAIHRDSVAAFITTD
jgi:S1-C subfamily serine protease